MRENKKQNKLNELAIKQNLLLWQLSQSFLNVEKKISQTVNINSKVTSYLNVSNENHN